MSAQRVGGLALLGLIVLQIIWHAWLVPPERAPLMLVLGIALLPLLPAILVYPRNPRRGLLLAGIVCLFYFSHGVAEAYSAPAERWLALAEVMLSTAIIGVLGWQSRGYKRPPKKLDA
jgi:uncharacterized membrane protein